MSLQPCGAFSLPRISGSTSCAQEAPGKAGFSSLLAAPRAGEGAWGKAQGLPAEEGCAGHRAPRQGLWKQPAGQRAGSGALLISRRREGS